MAQACTLTVSEASKAIRAGELTSEELVKSCLESIIKNEKDIQAWAILDMDAALERARMLDRSRPVGLLHGVPIGIKDVIDTRDFPTAYNSEIYTHHRPVHDAEIVTRALHAGAIILGKTTTQEFATRGKLSPTRNPHSLMHSPGGSSSGSAAAVAADMVPLALSSQTAGSIVRPASYCGVVGFKPSFDLIPMTGIKKMSPRLDTLGVHTRSVADAAIALQALSDWTGLASFNHGTTQAFTIGICREPYWHLAEPATQEALKLACEMLDRSNILVTDLILPEEFHALGKALDIISDVEVSASLNWEWENQRNLLSSGVQEKIERGHRTSTDTYQQALELSSRCAAQSALLFNQCHCILTPSSPGFAPLFESNNPGDSSFSKLWTILGMPSINLPIPSSGPLPIGLEIIGPQNKDLETLQIAYRIESIFKKYNF